MFAPLFHAWERYLASISKDRKVRPFEWGLDWLSPNGQDSSAPGEHVERWVAEVMSDTRRFFHTPPTSDYDFQALLSRRAQGRRRDAALPERVRHTTSGEQRRPRAMVSLGRRRASARAARSSCCRNGTPTAADTSGCRGCWRAVGVSALRLSLPYHDDRMPPELTRADYIVSSNIARTIQVCRQAVLDAKRADRLAGAAGIRAHRHPRHEPRFVPGDADDRARAADSRAGAEPCVALVCGRRVAGPLDAARARGSQRSSRAAAAAGALAADQSVFLSRPGPACADAAGVRALRPDVSGGFVAGRWSRSSASAACRTKCPCCPAGTTAPAWRRSSSWTATC